MISFSTGKLRKKPVNGVLTNLFSSSTAHTEKIRGTKFVKQIVENI